MIGDILTRNRYIFLSIAVFMLTACQSRVSVEESPTVSSLPTVLAVLPFHDMAARFGEGVNVRSPISGKVFMTGNVASGAADLLFDRLNRLLSERNDIELASVGRTEGTLAEILGNSASTMSDRNLALSAGKQMGATGVVVCYVYRFSQRVGRPYAAKSAASVAFEVHYLDVETGSVRWTGTIDETQRALSEDLLQIGTFLKRKGQWITAEEMALSGLKKIIKKFP